MDETLPEKKEPKGKAKDAEDASLYQQVIGIYTLAITHWTQRENGGGFFTLYTKNNAVPGTMSTTSYDRKWYAQLVGIFTSFSYTFDKEGHLFMLLQTLANKSLDKELSEREYQLYKITAQLLGQPLYQKNETATKLLLNTYCTFVKQVNEKADHDWLELCHRPLLATIRSLPHERKALQRIPTVQGSFTSFPSIDEKKGQADSSTSSTTDRELTLGKDSNAVECIQQSSIGASTTNRCKSHFFIPTSLTTLSSVSEEDAPALRDDTKPDIF